MIRVAAAARTTASALPKRLSSRESVICIPLKSLTLDPFVDDLKTLPGSDARPAWAYRNTLNLKNLFFGGFAPCRGLIRPRASRRQVSLWWCSSDRWATYASRTSAFPPREVGAAEAPWVFCESVRRPTPILNAPYPASAVLGHIHSYVVVACSKRLFSAPASRAIRLLVGMAVVVVSFVMATVR